MPPPPEHGCVYPEGFGSYVDGDIVYLKAKVFINALASWAEQCNESVSSGCC
ncbi:hypothetical protein O9992_17835 [Vibrio lentus]|nr:hypothetical protein [Vibrio lentus]